MHAVYTSVALEKSGTSCSSTAPSFSCCAESPIMKLSVLASFVSLAALAFATPNPLPGSSAYHINFRWPDRSSISIVYANLIHDY